MRRLVGVLVLVALGVGAILGVRTVDRMAVSYITSSRGVAGRGFAGEQIDPHGPVPGYAFLGFTRPSESPPGMRLVRPFETAREIGLSAGDVVTKVDGESFRSSRELVSYLVQHRRAGDVVTLTAVGRDGAPRELRLNLRAYIRHPGDLELPYSDVEIASDSGNVLRGWFIPPPERSDGRVGIFVHGANSSRFQALDNGGKHWHRRGYGLLTMDLSGHGSSDGEYITYTIDERLDVKSMLRWARHHPQIDPDRVVLFGTSNGAAAAIYAAAGENRPPPLALDAPYADFWDAAGTLLRSRGGHPILRYPLFAAVRLRAGLDLGSVRPAEAITKIESPVLFVHGDADRRIPMTHSEQMHRLRGEAGLPSELWVLPGGQHGFDDYPPEGIFWNRILDFFDRALGGPPTEWALEGR